jgi:hypothetical protein
MINKPGMHASRPIGDTMTRLFGFGATIAATCVLLVSCATEPQRALTEGQHKQRFSGEVRRPFDGQFLLYLPKGFSQHRAIKYPLLIFLHGSGESGIDIDNVKKHGPPQFLDDRPDFPFMRPKYRALSLQRRRALQFCRGYTIG